MRIFFFFIIVFTTMVSRAQKFEGLALTPPMGWYSGYSFQTNIDEKLVMEMADALVNSGMKKAGYHYIILNDGWMAPSRDNAGNLMADPRKFPRGMKLVSDYVHSRGLKLGLNNSAGTKTCDGYPGTRGYEFQDARLYASWEIDYLQFDWCFTEGINEKEAYTTMSNALRAAGRPILFSLSETSADEAWEWTKDIAHIRRSPGTGISPFQAIIMGPHNGPTNGPLNTGKPFHFNKLSGPGYWNDPRLPEPGKDMAMNKERTNFSLRCMLAAPLIVGNDLRRMDKETYALLTNNEIIAINQDSLGIQAAKFASEDSLQTWFKPLKGGDWAVCFVNHSAETKKINFNWKKQLIIDSTREKRILNTAKTTYKLRDVWKRKSLGTTGRSLKANLAAHDVLVLRLSR